MRRVRGSGAPHGAALRRPPGVPVWSYLVVLAMIPMIMVALGGALLVTERADEARASRAAERSMTEVAALDNLRNLLASELSSVAMQDAATALKLTREQVDAAFGESVAVPLPQARANTDRQLEYVRRSMPYLPGLAGLKAELLRSRQAVDLSFATPASARAAGFQTAVNFTDALESATRLEESVTSQLVQGQGSVPHSVVFVAAQLREVSDVMVAGAREGDLLYQISVAPNSQFVALAHQLDTMRGAYETSAQELPTNLSPALRAQYLALVHSGVPARFQAVVSRWIADRRESAFTLSSQIVNDVKSLATFSKDTRRLLHSAVQEGVEAASAARIRAVRAAWVMAAATILLLVLTAALLVSVSLRIHRRLVGLAEHAVRLRAGVLAPVVVRGPREVAIVTMALNAAADVLRRLTHKAEKLAAGDLDSPELDDVTEGPLGTVVDTSVQSVRRAMREREAFQRQLSYLASHDSLTGLPNRSEAEALVSGALEDAHRDGTRVAVLFVDLDRFKECNDGLGHRAGDHVLQVAAVRMRGVVRPADAVCRLGGDEFVILLAPAESAEHVCTVAERVVAALAEPDDYEGRDLRISASVGIALTEPGGAATLERMLHGADLAVYEAKDAGGNTWRLHQPVSGTPDERLTIDVAPG